MKNNDKINMKGFFYSHFNFISFHFTNESIHLGILIKKDSEDEYAYSKTKI